MEAADIELLKPIVQVFQDAWAQSGGNWLFLLPFIPLSIVQVYKLPFVQTAISSRWPKLAFSQLALGWQVLLSFVLGALPVFGGQLLLGVGVGTAVALAVSSGLAAVLGFKPLQAVHTAVGAKAYASLPPGVSRAASIVVPIDLEKVEAARAKASVQ